MCCYADGAISSGRHVVWKHRAITIRKASGETDAIGDMRFSETASLGSDSREPPLLRSRRRHVRVLFRRLFALVVVRGEPAGEQVNLRLGEAFVEGGHRVVLGHAVELRRV